MKNVIRHRPEEESELERRFRTTWEGMAYDITLNQEYSVGIMQQCAKRLKPWPIFGSAVVRILPGSRLPQTAVDHDKQHRIAFAHIPTKTAIELQGYDYHSQSRVQFTEDQRLQRELLAIGWTVIPFSRSEIFQNPHKCVEEAYTLIKRKEQTSQYQLYEDPQDYEWIELDEDQFEQEQHAQPDTRFP